MARIHERLFDRFRRRGDAAALGRVFDETAAELLRVALHLAPGPAEAEELLQDTYLAAIERAAAFDAKRRLVPWLIGLMGVQERRARRARARRPDPSRLRAPGALPAADEGELGDRVRDALDLVSDTLRPVLLLRLNHGLEPAEIANVLGEPPGTVRSKLHRGLAELRERLPDDTRLRASWATPALLGLETIRANVMHSATQAASTLAAASSVSAAVTLGGFVVTKAQLTLAVSALAALLALGAAWITFASPDTRRQAAEESGDAPSAADAPENEPRLVGRSTGGARAAPATRITASTVAVLDGWRVEGFVGGDGAPVAGASVKAFAYRGGVKDLLAQTTTDARGRFVGSLEKLKALTPLMRKLVAVELHVRAAGFAPRKPFAIESVPESTDAPYAPRAKIPLVRMPVVSGVVRESGGEAVSNARVMVFAHADRRYVKTVRTGPSGHYEVGIPAGRFVLVAHGGLHGVSDPADVSVESHGEQDVAPLVLRSTHWIEGTVVLADGEPFAGLPIYTRPRRLDEDGAPVPPATRLVRWREGFAISGKDGRFRMPVPIEGTYQIRAKGDFGRAVRCDCEAGDRDVRVVVRGHAVRAHVQDEAGRALPGASVMLRGWFPSNAPKLKDVEQGRIAIEDLHESSDFGLLDTAVGSDARVDALVPLGAALHVSVNVAGYVPAERSLHVPTKPGRTTLTLVLGQRPPTGTLALTVQGPGGEDIRNFGVSFLSPSGSVITHVRADEQGALPSVPAGVQRVSVLAGEAATWMEERFQLSSFYLPETVNVTIPEGRAVARTVRVRLGGRVRIAVDVPDALADKKLSTLRAHLTSVDDTEGVRPIPLSMFVREGDDGLQLSGRFFAGKAALAAKLVEPGDYVLHAIAKGVRLESKRVTVLAGKIADVTLMGEPAADKK